MSKIANLFTGPFRMLAVFRLYRWWNTSPGNNHIGRHRPGRAARARRAGA